MAKVTAYRNTERHCFCKMKFRNRERILVSVANTPRHGIKVFKLMAGIFPVRTIWEYTATATADEDGRRELVALLLGRAEEKPAHPLDAIITKLAACKSCDEAVRVLHRAEREAGRAAEPGNRADRPPKA